MKRAKNDFVTILLVTFEPFRLYVREADLHIQPSLVYMKE